MTNKLVLASAGAGKTERIVTEALSRCEAGESVLIVTYTENNQKEIMHRICKKNGACPRNLYVKGWFSFLLEDVIRPYQRYIFSDRIVGINFNEHGDPHKRDGRTIFGRGEKNTDGTYNALHYLTTKRDKAHTMYLSRLAVRVCEESNQPLKIGRRRIKVGRPTMRLQEIYNAIFIDEVQDLVGWDYEIIRFLSAVQPIDVICVGDFRQTIYRTSNASKTPKSNDKKIAKFEELEFEIENLNISYRCIQDICDFADALFDSTIYQPTISQVDEVPPDLSGHQGLFIVTSDKVGQYMTAFNPVILRHSKNSAKDLCEGHSSYNFGKAKGLGFKRVLIIPTARYKKFLSNDASAFSGGGSDEALNKLYVALTRARYSVAFLYDDNVGIAGINMWDG